MTNLDAKARRRSSMNDNVRSLDRLVKHTVLGDALLQDHRLDTALVLAAVLAEPGVGLLLLAKREADRVTEVEEAEGDGGSDETGGASDDGEDLLAVERSGRGHVGVRCGWSG